MDVSSSLLFGSIRDKVRHGLSIAEHLSATLSTTSYLSYHDWHHLLVSQQIYLTDEEIAYCHKKCTDFHHKEHINLRKFVKGIDLLVPHSHTDPEQFDDVLPQPYRMIAKILEMDILDVAWLEIIRRQPDLFRLPDGITPVHLARNQALSNVCVPTTIVPLAQASDSRMLGGVTSLAAAVGGLSFFTSARGHGTNDTKFPTFGVADMTKGTVLTHVALSPIQYKPTLSTIETSVKETAAAAAAGAVGKEGSSDGTTPTWQIVDLRSMDGGFWIAEVCYTTGRPSTIRVAVAMKVSPYVAEEPSTKENEDRPDPLQRKGSVKGGGATLERKASVKGEQPSRKGSVKKGSPSKSSKGGETEVIESQASDDQINANVIPSIIEVPEKRIEGPCEIHVFVLEIDFDFEALAAVADGRLPAVPSLQHGNIDSASVKGGIRVVGAVAVPIQSVTETIGISLSSRGDYLTICTGTGLGTGPVASPSTISLHPLTMLSKRARERQRRDTPKSTRQGGTVGQGLGPGQGQGMGGLGEELGHMVVLDALEKSSVREGDPSGIVPSGGTSVNDGGSVNGSVTGEERGGDGKDGNIATTPTGLYPMLVPYKVNLMLGTTPVLAQGQGLGQGSLTPPRLSQASGPGLGPAEISSLTVASYHTALMLSNVTSTVATPLPTVYTEPPPAQDGGSTLPDSSTPLHPPASASVSAWFTTTIDVALLLRDLPAWAVLRGRVVHDNNTVDKPPPPAAAPSQPTDQAAASAATPPISELTIADALIGVKPVPKVLEMRVIDWFKLSSPCTAYAMHTTGIDGGIGGPTLNHPSALALGLRDGSVCLWDVSSPARAMLSVLGQHSYRRGCAVSALQFWAPKGLGLGLGAGVVVGGNVRSGGGGGGGVNTTNRRATTTNNTISVNNINNNINLTTVASPVSLRLISGAEDGTICFFDVIPTPTLLPIQQLPQLSSGPARGPGLGGDGLRDYRNDFVGIGLGEGWASKVVKIEVLHYHVGIALVVLQDGRNALYDVAVGRLLGRVLSQRGLVNHDARNRVALYKGALRRRGGTGQVGQASAPGLATTAAPGLATASTSASGPVSTTISGGGDSSLHDRPLLITSGGKLVVLYNDNDISTTTTNNNNSNNNHHHKPPATASSPYPPLAACYDLHVLIPTLYPDLDIPMPGDVNQRRWAMLDLFCTLTTEDRASLGVFKPSGVLPAFLGFMSNPSTSNNRRNTMSAGNNNNNNNPLSGTSSPTSRRMSRAATSNNNNNNPGASPGPTANTGFGSPTSRSGLGRTASFNGANLADGRSVGSGSGSGALAALNATQLMLSMSLGNGGIGGSPPLVVAREPAFVAKKQALGRSADRLGRKARVLRKLTDLSGDL